MTTPGYERPLQELSGEYPLGFTAWGDLPRPSSSQCAGGVGGGSSPPDAGGAVGILPPGKASRPQAAYTLPGEAGTPHPTCGRAKRAFGCRGGGSAIQTKIDATPGTHKSGIVREHCDRPTCPTCWESWKTRQAKRAGERVRSFKLLARTRGSERHFQISPPPSLVRDLTDRLGARGAAHLLRKRGVEIARRHGLYAFGLVLHPWRTRATGAGRYRRGRNYWSPHLHLVSFGALTRADEFTRQTGGWVYKNLTEENGYAEPEAVFSYILDHAGVVEGEQVLRWYGRLSSKSFVIDKETKVEEPVLCDCGRECREYGLTHDDEIDWTRDYGVFLVKVRKRSYRLIS